MSEMAFARFLIRDHPKERARLRRADNEALFGLQFATNNIGEGVRAAELAAAAGAAWVDLNCGCPIYGAPADWEHVHLCGARHMRMAVERCGGAARAFICTS